MLHVAVFLLARTVITAGLGSSASRKALDLSRDSTYKEIFKALTGESFHIGSAELLVPSHVTLKEARLHCVYTGYPCEDLVSIGCDD